MASPEDAANLTDREKGLSEIGGFLDDARSGLSAVILEGPPGIGRTSLWRSGVDLARDRGCRLLVARPAEAGAGLSFSVLGDLFRAALAGGRETVPAPHRRGREAAPGMGMARALELSRRAPEAGAPLPVPDSLRGVLRERLKALDAATRDVLLAVALMAEPDQAAVAGAVGSEDVARAAFDEGERAGLLEFDEARVRLAHPLLGSVLYADASEERRRDLHRRLA